ncbi:MAG: DNA-directed RNA polymerase subunit delta [Bacilli bacterium]|jgi:DNA-directed RNA polymerase subunit delta|nr:DNA-directed RNA polymerase subunit delta [Bacilli bacterium]
MNQSKTDIAYEILKEVKSGLPFEDIWMLIKDELDLDEEEAQELISPFYTDLSFDARFITLGENIWDLRESNSFDKVHIDMNDIYVSSDNDIIELEDGIVSKEDTEEVLFEEEVEPSVVKEK